MPSQRKRIGFLPRSEVQNIINKICKQNNLSQSKVTGILVEEALNYRGLINCSIEKISFASTENLNIEKENEIEYINFDDKDINEEIKLINDFIEFKFFKNIMKKNKKNI